MKETEALLGGSLVLVVDYIVGVQDKSVLQEWYKIVVWLLLVEQYVRGRVFGRVRNYNIVPYWLKFIVGTTVLVLSPRDSPQILITRIWAVSSITA